jgi:hypothetical protein
VRVLLTRPLEGDIDTDHESESKDDSLNRRILAEPTLNASRSGLFLESLLAQSCDSSSLSGVASWRVTGSKGSLMADSYSAKIRRVYGPGVVTTWSGSGEGVDGLSGLTVPREFDSLLQSDRHGVSDVDCDDVSPASSDLVERIGDCDSLVIDHNLGANEDQVGDGQEKSRPERSGDATCEGEVAKALVGVDRRSDHREGEEDVATSRAEDFGIGHGAILSRGVMAMIESTGGVTR